MKKDYKKSGKTNIKKLSGIVLSVVLVGGLIAGCGGKVVADGDLNTGQAEVETTAEVQTTEAVKDKVTVKNDAETKGNTETTTVQKDTAKVAPEATTAVVKEPATEASKKPSVTSNNTPAKQDATTAAAVDNTSADTPNTPEKPQPTEAPKPVEKPTEKPIEEPTEAPKPIEKPTETLTQAPIHVHSWDERVIGERIVVDKPAWDEQIEVLPERDVQEIVGGYLQCNTCGDPWPCSDELHGGSHTEYIYETVHKPAEYRTVHHDAETHKENITETYCTGCGEIR